MKDYNEIYEEHCITPTAQKRPEAVKRELRIYYNGRNVLDLYNNLETNSSTWNFRYSHLPEKNNISMFWANRSLYNRLGPNGLTPVYTISKCECCDFQFTSDCPNSYLSETSLVLSSTTSSPMMFTTASSTKRAEFRPPKAALSVTPTLNLSSGFKHHQQHQQQQQQLREHKNCPEPTINKQFINQNKPKISDMFSTKNTGLFAANNNNNNNNNGYFNNLNKFNNGICSTKTIGTTDLSQLASNLVSMNFSNSTSYTPPLINYGNNVVHNNDYNETMLSKNSKSNVPMPTTNLFNNSSINLANLNTPVASANYSFQDNNIFSNNIHPNQIHSGNSVGNKSQSSSSNNLFSLFNSNNNNNNNNNNTNNSVNHAFSANVESNTFINSFNNPLNNNNRNNIGNNPLTVNSQNYGRMYKYF